jgi:hypothetical protein
MDPYGTTTIDQYLSGLPGFGPSSGGGSQPFNPANGTITPTASAKTTGPKFSTLLLALAGLGVITWIVGPNLGIWVPILALGGYAAVQSGFVNGLLNKYVAAV